MHEPENNAMCHTNAVLDSESRGSLLWVGLIIAVSALLAFVVEPHIGTPVAAPAAHHAVTTMAAAPRAGARR
jgi:hypothetical protein